MNEHPTRRRWFQVHLSTVCIMMGMIGLLMYMNFRKKTLGYGSSFPDGGEFSVTYAYGWPKIIACDYWGWQVELTQNEKLVGLSGITGPIDGVLYAHFAKLKKNGSPVKPLETWKIPIPSKEGVPHSKWYHYRFHEDGGYITDSIRSAVIYNSFIAVTILAATVALCEFYTRWRKRGREME